MKFKSGVYRRRGKEITPIVVGSKIPRPAGSIVNVAKGHPSTPENGLGIVPIDRFKKRQRKRYAPTGPDSGVVCIKVCISPIGK